MVAIGVRFCFELLDNYVGQFCAMFLPHCYADAFFVESENIIGYTRFYHGAMRYFQSLRWETNTEDAMYITGDKGSKFSLSAFPVGLPLAAAADVGKHVFHDSLYFTMNLCWHHLKTLSFCILFSFTPLGHRLGRTLETVWVEIWRANAVHGKLAAGADDTQQIGVQIQRGSGNGE